MVVTQAQCYVVLYLGDLSIFLTPLQGKEYFAVEEPEAQKIVCGHRAATGKSGVRSPANLSHLPPTLCHWQPLWHPGFLSYVPGALLL